MPLSDPLSRRRFVYRHVSALILTLIFAFAQQASGECVDPDDVKTSLTLASPDANKEALASGWTELSARLCVSVTWTGKTRPMPQPASEFMDIWVPKIARNKNIRMYFQSEVQVKEGAREYWLLIQEQLLPPFREEVGVGGDVTLQIKRFGSLAGGPYVFAIQGFLTGEPPLELAELEIVGIPKGELEKTSDMLRDLIERHPSDAVRTELGGWIEDGIVAYSMSTDGRASEISVVLYEVDGALAPVMLINSKWLLNPITGDAERDRKYKQIVLYHEYFHLRDHFDGTLELLPLQLQRADVDANPNKYAETIWRAEYRATKAEVAFAVEQGWGDAMFEPWNRSDVQSDSIQFLDAFYSLISTSTQNTSDKRALSKFRKQWKKIYNRERKALKKR